MPLLFCLFVLSNWMAGGADAAPGYRVEQRANVWRLVAPDGKAFFSRGVCCVNMGMNREQYNAARPGYAAWQQYDEPVSWADATVQRLRSWGFTTIGGWSDTTTLRRSRRMDMAITPVLHLGSTAGAPWFDMWDPKVIARMDEVAREQILPIRDDPHLLGYYTDNEMGWWNAALFKMTLEQPAGSGQRQRLVKLLRDQYRGRWDALLRDFEPRGAAGFAELDRAGVLYLRPGGRGIRVVRRFLELAAARYYELSRQLIRKYDRRGLILGDRYQSFYYPEVARAAGRSVDVVSTNLNANWNDGTFARFYLETLHALCDKPILVGEFYMTARENRSGNKNDSSGFPVVQTQRERAEGFRNTLTALQRLPFVVGADWFQYYDEPTFGRDDGENYNMGLVDIHDQPYRELTAAAAALPQPALPQATGAKWDASEGVPRAPREPAADLKPMLALKRWDRERGFVRPTTRFPIADLYLCWEPDAVYLGLLAMDFPEDTYYVDKRIPEADRMEWRVHVNAKREPIRARLGAGRGPIVTGAGATIAGPDHHGQDVRVVAVMKLPAAAWGKSKLRRGDRITLASTLLTHARAYRVAWAGSFTLAE
jgi:hypothetical protein